MLKQKNVCYKYRKSNLMTKGKIIIKETTQVSGHSLKLHICMFERSQGKHNNLNCRKKIWIIFH